jgi:hypothetical protein
MPGISQPDPKLLPRMVTVALSERPAGFWHRPFDCPKSGHSETRMLASDPLQSGAAGGINGELRSPQ